MEIRPETKLTLSTAEVKILLEFFPKGLTAFDLEMTGLSPLFDKMIEIAGVKLESSGEIKTYHSLINPLIPIPEHTIKYHGLTNQDLRDAPTTKAPTRNFLEFVDNTPLLAHNAMFDASFLIMAIFEFNLQPGLSDVFDSCKLGRTLAKALKNKVEKLPKSSKLADLADFYEISFDHHQALDDSIVCMKIFAKLLAEYKKHSIQTGIKDLCYLFKLSTFKKREDYILPNKLASIKEKVQGQIICEIKYKGGSVRDAYRPIKPLSMLALPQGLVLYAECLNSNINKYFKVQKIQSVRDMSLTE